ncbi:sperm axonemal maintenance protein CFAP97D1-like [Dysidea avara]|uniref:sperm axonemal maintenance protein CFAP97D1-like n=1 Tax=Dysidea avara TaxID=196820 RepID=UPI0033303860
MTPPLLPWRLQTFIMDAKKYTSANKSRKSVYQPVTAVKPACNQTLRRKWDDQTYSKHRERVKNARSLIDNKAPRIYYPMNLKKAQAEEQRKARIDQSNRMMLEKIAHIMKTKGGVDDWNNEYTNNKPIHSTFHQIFRQQQLDRINNDNKILMERLQSVKPYYNKSEWVNHHLKHLRHSTYISQFNPSWMRSNDKLQSLLKV